MDPASEPTPYAQQLVALGRILQTFREEEDIDVLIETAVAYLQAEFDYRLIWIGLYDRLDHRLFGRGGRLPNTGDAILRQQFSLTPGDLLEQVVIQQRPVGVPDLRNEIRAGEWRRVAQHFNIQGTMLFPIRYKDRCFGVALLGSHLWGVSPRSEDKARLSMMFGGLAGALYQIEADWQRKQVKRPEQPLLSLVSALRLRTSLVERLEAVVEQTHNFVQPSRTNIYWFERQRRYFWRRVGNLHKTGLYNDAAQPVSGITVQNLGDFYHALAADNLVVIGEAQSSLKTDVTSRLLRQLKARSLMASPILFRDELLGFLAVEGTEARIWEDEEKSYVRGAAQLVAVTAPLENLEAVINQTRSDQMLLAEVNRAIYTDEDWRMTLDSVAEQVCQRLQVERFIVLLYNKITHHFEVCYQRQPASRRPLTETLPTLSDVDRHMLEKSHQAIGVESLDHELKLMTWRSALVGMGLRSLLLCNTAVRHPIEGLVLVGHEATRSWSQAEHEIVRVVSQQIGLILHQWQLQRQVHQTQRFYQQTQASLTAIQATNSLDQLEQQSLQQIAETLEAPLAVLLTWLPGQKTAKLTATPTTDDQFTVKPDALILTQTDALIQWGLQHEGVIPLDGNMLALETRLWLSGSGIGQVLLCGLRTNNHHEVTGVVLVADRAHRTWLPQQQESLALLTQQLAWFRRYWLLSDRLDRDREQFKQLNWYKHRRLEETYRAIDLNTRRLKAVIEQQASDASSQKTPLQTLQYQQIVRQLEDTLSTISPVLQYEHWQLKVDLQTLPLTTLLKRALDRVDGLIKQRQIWYQVHNNEGNLLIQADPMKLELILNELLSLACQRCELKGRVDVWCRSIDRRWLELSITDNGEIDPQLVNDFQAGRSPDLLAPSRLDYSPGLNLVVCQVLAQEMGGDFNLYRLKDSRVLNRLILPLAVKT